MGTFHGSGIADSQRAQKAGQILAAGAVGIRHPAYRVSGKRFQGLAVLEHFLNDALCRQHGQVRVVNRVNGNLKPAVVFPDFLRGQAGYMNSAVLPVVFLSGQTGIQIKCGFDSVFPKHFHKAQVLADAVVKAEVTAFRSPPGKQFFTIIYKSSSDVMLNTVYMHINQKIRFFFQKFKEFLISFRIDILKGIWRRKVCKMN